jgi:hypothetical protein
MHYPPKIFLEDLEKFSLAVRRVAAMEREKIKVFDILVEKVMKTLQSALSSHDRGSSKWVNVSEKNGNGEDNGLADYFSSAVDTIIACTTLENEVCI